MRALGRLILIGFGLMVASMVGGLVLLSAVLIPVMGQLELGPLVDQSGFYVALGAVFFSGYAVLPALIVALAAEIWGLRSALFFAATGAAIGLLLGLHLEGIGLTGFGSPNFDLRGFAVHGFARREIEILAGAGILSGLTYWLIAGRSAGRGAWS